VNAVPALQHDDPYAAFRFLVEIEGLVVGGFSEVSGLQAEIDIEEYREGGVNDYVHHLPKGTKYPRLVLKRGLTDSDTLWKWQTNIRDGQVERHTVHIILLDEQRNRKWDWRLIDAYPTKWSGPDFNAGGRAIAVESLEMAHHGIRKD
jgi:phage tail-like protein